MKIEEITKDAKVIAMILNKFEVSDISIDSDGGFIEFGNVTIYFDKDKKITETSVGL